MKALTVEEKTRANSQNDNDESNTANKGKGNLMQVSCGSYFFPSPSI